MPWTQDIAGTGLEASFLLDSSHCPGNMQPFGELSSVILLRCGCYVQQYQLAQQMCPLCSSSSLQWGWPAALWLDGRPAPQEGLPVNILWQRCQGPSGENLLLFLLKGRDVPVKYLLNSSVYTHKIVPIPVLVREDYFIGVSSDH